MRSANYFAGANIDRAAKFRKNAAFGGANRLPGFVATLARCPGIARRACLREAEASLRRRQACPENRFAAIKLIQFGRIAL